LFLLLSSSRLNAFLMPRNYDANAGYADANPNPNMHGYGQPHQPYYGQQQQPYYGASYSAPSSSWWPGSGSGGGWWSGFATGGLMSHLWYELVID
jgi:hypothetical protein